MGRILELECHPNRPGKAVRAVSVEVPATLREPFDLRFIVDGDIEAILLPEGSDSPEVTDDPVDELWLHTCFELFARSGTCPGYSEFNYAPSGAWAIYHFAEYRRDMVREYEGAPEEVLCQRGPHRFEVEILNGFSFHSCGRLALSAVIEETDGTKSYWALAHPPGAPDFHHPDCFTLELPPQGAA